MDNGPEWLPPQLRKRSTWLPNGTTAPLGNEGSQPYADGGAEQFLLLPLPWPSERVLGLQAGLGVVGLRDAIAESGNKDPAGDSGADRHAKQMFQSGDSRQTSKSAPAGESGAANTAVAILASEVRVEVAPEDSPRILVQCTVGTIKRAILKALPIEWHQSRGVLGYDLRCEVVVSKPLGILGPASGIVHPIGCETIPSDSASGILLGIRLEGDFVREDFAPSKVAVTGDETDSSVFTFVGHFGELVEEQSDVKKDSDQIERCRFSGGLDTVAWAVQECIKSRLAAEPWTSLGMLTWPPGAPMYWPPPGWNDDCADIQEEDEEEERKESKECEEEVEETDDKVPEEMVHESIAVTRVREGFKELFPQPSRPQTPEDVRAERAEAQELEELEKQLAAMEAERLERLLEEPCTSCGAVPVAVVALAWPSPCAPPSCGICVASQASRQRLCWRCGMCAPRCANCLPPEVMTHPQMAVPVIALGMLKLPVGDQRPQPMILECGSKEVSRLPSRAGDRLPSRIGDRVSPSSVAGSRPVSRFSMSRSVRIAGIAPPKASAQGSRPGSQVGSTLGSAVFQSQAFESQFDVPGPLSQHSVSYGNPGSRLGSTLESPLESQLRPSSQLSAPLPPKSPRPGSQLARPGSQPAQRPGSQLGRAASQLSQYPSNSHPVPSRPSTSLGIAPQNANGLRSPEPPVSQYGDNGGKSTSKAAAARDFGIAPDDGADDAIRSAVLEPIEASIAKLLGAPGRVELSSATDASSLVITFYKQGWEHWRPSREISDTFQSDSAEISLDRNIDCPISLLWEFQRLLDHPAALQPYAALRPWMTAPPSLALRAAATVRCADVALVAQRLQKASVTALTKQMRLQLASAGFETIADNLTAQETQEKLSFDASTVFDGIAELRGDGQSIDKGMQTLVGRLQTLDAVQELLKMMDSVRDGSSPLHLAAQMGMRKVMHVLLKSFCKSKMNASNHHGYTPLMVAIMHGSKGIVRDLIDCGCKLNDRDRKGCSCIHHCILSRREDMLPVLIKAKAKLGQQDYQGRTPLHLALEMSQTDMVGLLINAGAKFNIQNEEGEAPLHLAVSHNHVDFVQVMICSGAPLDLADGKGNTALHLAACLGRERICGMLIRGKCAINCVDKRGKTPLICAAEFARIDVVRALLQFKANVQMNDVEQNSALHYAAMRGQQVVATSLLSAGHEVNVMNVERQTPLHFAVEYGHVDLARAFMDLPGVYCNHVDKRRKAAIYIAAEKGNVEMMKILIIRCNATLPGPKGRTPLHIAALHGHADPADFEISLEDRVDELPENGVLLCECITTMLAQKVKQINAQRLNSKDVGGRTPLHLAVLAGQDHVVKALTRSGSDCNERDEISGSAKSYLHKTPLHYACQLQRRAAVEALIDSRADLNIQDVYDNSALHHAVLSYSPHMVPIADLMNSAGEYREKLEGYDRTLHQKAETDHYEIAEEDLPEGVPLEAVDETSVNPWQKAPCHVESQKYVDDDDRDWYELAGFFKHPLGACQSQKLTDSGLPSDLPCVFSRRVKKWVLCKACEVALQDSRFQIAYDILNLLLKKAEANPNPVDQESFTPLSRLCALKDDYPQWDYEPMISMFQESKGEQSIHYCARAGKVNELRALLAKGADPSEKSKALSRTPLHIAAEQGNSLVASVLLMAKADVVAVDDHGKTPMHYAALYSHLEVVQLLCDYQIDPNLKDHEGILPMDLAYSRAIVQMLKGIGAKRSLWGTVSVGNTEMVKIMIDKAADVEAKNRLQRRIIHAAVQKKHGEVLWVILQKKADPDAQDYLGWTPLHYAAAIPEATLVQILLTGQANPEVVDVQGKTPLKIATENGYHEVRQYIDGSRPIQWKEPQMVKMNFL